MIALRLLLLSRIQLAALGAAGAALLLAGCTHALPTLSRGPASSAPHPVDLRGARIEVIHGYGVQRDQILEPLSTDDGQAYRMQALDYGETSGLKAYLLRLRSAEEMLRRKNFSEDEFYDLLRSFRGLSAGSVTAIRIYEAAEGRETPQVLTDLNSSEYTTSTLLISAGQVPETFDVDLNIQGIRRGDVAFMKQERFAAYAAKIDREKEKHIFEFIAGSNLEAKGRFRFVFAEAILLAAQQVLEQGGKLDEAFVYLHTTRSENRNRFAGVPPDGKPTEGFNFSDVTDFGEGHSIHRRSLRELINDFLPHLYFAATRDKFEALRTDPASALELLHAIENVEPRTLDVYRSEEERLRATTEDMSNIGRGGILTRDPSRIPELEVRLHDRGFLTSARAELLAKNFHAPIDVVQALLVRNQVSSPLEGLRSNNAGGQPSVEIELHGDLTLEKARLDLEELKHIYRDDLKAVYLEQGYAAEAAARRAIIASEQTEWRIHVDPKELRHLKKLSKLLDEAGFRPGPEPFVYSSRHQVTRGKVGKVGEKMHHRLNMTRSKRHFELKAP